MKGSKWDNIIIVVCAIIGVVLAIGAVITNWFGLSISLTMTLFYFAVCALILCVYNILYRKW